MRFPHWLRAPLFQDFRKRGERILRWTAVGIAMGVALASIGFGLLHLDAADPVALTAGASPQAVPRSPAAALAGGGAAAAKPLADGTVPPLTRDDGTTDAGYDVVDGVKVFHLTAAPLTWSTGVGAPKQAYAFNGLVPGPNIRLVEGDHVRIIVKNDLPEGLAVHWHGMILPNDQDGVPDLTQPAIPPGGTFTYEWTAVVTGTHWYHTHMDGTQEGKGLYGSLEVAPRIPFWWEVVPPQHDYHLEVNDGFLGFVFNGKSYPATTPLHANVGDRVHIRVVDTGPEMCHAIHMHGGPFQVVAQDGMPLTAPQLMDTLTICPGQTFDIIWIPSTPGKWMLHCHIFSHSETANGMQGMVTIMDVDPATVALPPLAATPSATTPSAAPTTSGSSGLPALPLPSLPGLNLPGLPSAKN